MKYPSVDNQSAIRTLHGYSAFRSITHLLITISDQDIAWVFGLQVNYPSVDNQSAIRTLHGYSAFRSNFFHLN